MAAATKKTTEESVSVLQGQGSREHRLRFHWAGQPAQRGVGSGDPQPALQQGARRVSGQSENHHGGGEPTRKPHRHDGRERASRTSPGRSGDQISASMEALGGSGAGSFDYSREPVDGGDSSESITDRQIDAGFKLEEARKHIGTRCFAIVEKVAGEGVPVSTLGTSHREKTTLADYLRNALDDLSDLWGMKTKAKRPVANL